MTESFTNKSDNKKSVVLIEYPKKGSWAVGFATKKNKSEISKKTEKNLIKIIDIYTNKEIPIMPVKATDLMEKFKIPEGRSLGSKLKILEETWVQNGFFITESQIKKIIKN